jgi:hypothetical protein
MGHGGQPEAPEGQRLHPMVRRVELHLVHALAPLVPLAQNGRVLVRLVREAVQLPARHLAHGHQVRVGAREGVSVHHRRAEPLEIAVGEVEVRPSRGRHGGRSGRRHRLTAR